MEVARVDLTLERDPRSGRFPLASATSSLLPVTPETKPDPQVLELARPYHEAAERDLDTKVAEPGSRSTARAAASRTRRWWTRSTKCNCTTPRPR